MQDRPTALELIEALGDFMRERASNARDRWERFQFQVAANSLGIIARELELGDGFMREEWRGLDELIGREDPPPEQAAFVARLRARNEELSERIRRGEFDGGDAEAALMRHIWKTVVDKAAIASPNEKP